MKFNLTSDSPIYYLIAVCNRWKNCLKFGSAAVHTVFILHASDPY